MSDASAARARVQASIVWELQAGPLHLRCLPLPSGGFAVQARGSKGWDECTSGADALKLLRAVVMLPAVARATKT